MPEWKMIPWTEQPKTHKDLLLDILIDIPGLLEELDSMRDCSCTERKHDLQKSVSRNCWLLDEQLRAWAEAYHSFFESSGVSWPPSACITASVAQLNHAHCLSLYWVGCLIIDSTLKFALGPEAGALPERTDPRVYMRNIAGVIPVLLRPSSGMHGQHIAVFPLGIALQYAMADDSMAEEQEMLVSNFECPRGHVVNGFLLSVNCDEPRYTEPLSKLDGPASISARAKSWVGV